MTVLNGHDIAGPNGAGVITSALSGASFVIVKSTEGYGYNDALHDYFAEKVRAAGKLLGHYHYAWPEYSYAQCADHFIAQSKALPGEVLALDFEPYRSKAPRSSWASWVAAFASRVRSQTGAPCWLYANDTHLSDLLAYATASQRKVIQNMPLWKAGNNDAYESRPTTVGDLHGWPNVTAWQWNGTTLDKDQFFGSSSTWRALGLPGDPAPAPKPKPKPKPVPKPTPLTVDGVLGKISTERLQARMGTPVDGWISGQNSAFRPKLKQWTRVKYTAKHDGSLCIAALQRKIGATDDGVLGPISSGDLQRWLNKHAGAHLVVDESPGVKTVEALQRALNEGKL